MKLSAFASPHGAVREMWILRKREVARSAFTTLPRRSPGFHPQKTQRGRPHVLPSWMMDCWQPLLDSQHASGHLLQLCGRRQHD
jgi:hypothetical protein